jgi:hypothetical protein
MLALHVNPNQQLNGPHQGISTGSPQRQGGGGLGRPGLSDTPPSDNPGRPGPPPLALGGASGDPLITADALTLSVPKEILTKV